MCNSAERTYQGNPRAPAAAREFGNSLVMAALVPAGWALADDVAIVVSELVTEALQAGAGSIRVQVTTHWDRLTIMLDHDHADRLVPQEPDDAAVTRRRVLQMLTAELATSAEAEDVVRIRADVRCDPRYTVKVPCRYRRTS